MEAALIEPEDYAATDHGYIGAVPVRNIWLLMLYASDLFRIKGTDLTGIENMPDDLPDLIGEILARSRTAATTQIEPWLQNENGRT